MSEGPKPEVDVTQPPPLEREVWTPEEAKAIRRARAIAAQRGVRLLVACTDPRCAEMPLIYQVDGPGGALWRCCHKEREMGR